MDADISSDQTQNISARRGEEAAPVGSVSATVGAQSHQSVNSLLSQIPKSAEGEPFNADSDCVVGQPPPGAGGRQDQEVEGDIG